MLWEYKFIGISFVRTKAERIYVTLTQSSIFIIYGNISLVYVDVLLFEILMRRLYEFYFLSRQLFQVISLTVV